MKELERVKIVLNGESRDVAEGTTVAGLLCELGIKPQHCAVERNLELVPRPLHADQTLKPGDRVEVVTLVGGG